MPSEGWGFINSVEPHVASASAGAIISYEHAIHPAARGAPPASLNYLLPTQADPGEDANLTPWRGAARQPRG